MKFKLTAEDESELSALVEQLDKWVKELEEFDLSGYAPVLVPAGESDRGHERSADD